MSSSSTSISWAPVIEKPRDFLEDYAYYNSIAYENDACKHYTPVAVRAGDDYTCLLHKDCTAKVSEMSEFDKKHLNISDASDKKKRRQRKRKN